MEITEKTLKILEGTHPDSWELIVPGIFASDATVARVLRIASADTVDRVLGLASDDTVASVLRIVSDATVDRVLGIASADTVASVLRIVSDATMARVLGIASAGTVDRVLGLASDDTVDRWNKFRAAIPILVRPYTAIYKKTNGGSCNLKMDSWHCETTHCMAGWLVTLAGDAGKALEAKFSTSTAARMILAASAPGMPLPNFYASTEAATEFLKAMVEIEATAEGRA